MLAYTLTVKKQAAAKSVWEFKGLGDVEPLYKQLIGMLLKNK